MCDQGQFLFTVKVTIIIVTIITSNALSPL